MQQLRLHYCTAISLHTQLQALLSTDTQNALQNAEHNANTARERNKTMWEELRLKQHKYNRRRDKRNRFRDSTGGGQGLHEKSQVRVINQPI